MLQNNIMFKKGDLVCQKQCYKSPLGVVSQDIKNLRPWMVDIVIPDTDWNNRIGECGCANEYILKAYDSDCAKAKRYQYELVLWKSVKDRVIESLEKELEELKKL